MLYLTVLCGLVHLGVSACSLTGFDFLRRCQNDDIANPPCSVECQTAVQEASECTQRDQELESVLQTYSFCKPQPAARCKLILQRELCRGSCQWCNGKCLTRDATCQKAPVNCSSLVQLQCNTQCQWCPDTQTCEKSCAPSAPPATCVDDPQAKLDVFGYTCTSLLEVTSNNCEYDLSSLDPTLNGVTSGKLCPKSCAQCSSDPLPSTSATSTSAVCEDDPDGIVAQQGFNCQIVLQVTANNCDYDLSTLSPQIPKGVTPGQICPKSCNRCVSISSSNTMNSSSTNCSDDPEGLAAQQGLTCPNIIQYVNNNCDIDLNSLNPNVPAGLTAAKLCPGTCKRCGSNTASKPTQACVDDPSGLVKSNGFTCSTILSVTGNNCNQDLNTLSSSIPKGITPGQLCPKSCGRCADANGNRVPVPQQTTDTFINGKLMTAAQKSWLQRIGVQLPPGRFFLRPDGSVGLEGGPVLLNVYHTVGQKVDTAVTGAMRDSGIENAAVKTKEGVLDAVDWTKQAAQTTGQAVKQAAQKTKTGFQNFFGRVSNFFG